MPDSYIRFTAAKELCHIIIDTEEEWSTDGTETLRELLYELSFDNDAEAMSVVQSETFAELVALELLYPYAERDGDRIRLAKGELTMNKIASFYKIPVPYVSRALTKSYHEMIGGLWQLI